MEEACCSTELTSGSLATCFSTFPCTGKSVSYYTSMHLSKTTYSAIHLFFVDMCSLGIEPTTFCAANAMLYHWVTGTLLLNMVMMNGVKWPFMKTHLTVSCSRHVCFALWKQNINKSSIIYSVSDLFSLLLHTSVNTVNVNTVLYSIFDLPIPSQLMSQDNKSLC